MKLGPFSTYGRRQSIRAVITTIVVQLLSRRTEVWIGNLEARRNQTFVSDTEDGYLKAGQLAGIEGETAQLGRGRAVSIGEFLGVEATPRVGAERPRPKRREVMVPPSDTEKIGRVLGWRPTISLEDKLTRTAAWLLPNSIATRPTAMRSETGGPGEKAGAR